MKLLLSTVLILFGMSCFAQENDRISSMDFVEILNDNRSEALFYYQNNWEELRKSAIERGYIDSYQLIETPYTEEGPYHFILITTYSNQKQYEKREQNFEKLIGERGGLKLLNDKKSSDFRKIVYYKEMVRHWN